MEKTRLTVKHTHKKNHLCSLYSNISHKKGMEVGKHWKHFHQLIWRNVNQFTVFKTSENFLNILFKIQRLYIFIFNVSKTQMKIVLRKVSKYHPTTWWEYLFSVSGHDNAPQLKISTTIKRKLYIKLTDKQFYKESQKKFGLKVEILHMARM